jgi:hypothetical protein
MLRLRLLSSFITDFTRPTPYSVARGLFYYKLKDTHGRYRSWYHNIL